MLLALEEDTNNSLRAFELNLKKQEQNISEIGEKETTKNLRKNFTKYAKNQSNFDFHKSVRSEIFKIMALNMQAIQRKSELLNITQVETGNIQLSIILTDPKSILEYALNANKTQAEQKQIQLKIDSPENLPLVIADSEKMAWVLINLISNAIRYSHEDSTIHLSIIVENQHVKFMVKDTGQGIAPQYKDKVFDRYFPCPRHKKGRNGTRTCY